MVKTEGECLTSIQLIKRSASTITRSESSAGAHISAASLIIAEHSRHIALEEVYEPLVRTGQIPPPYQQEAVSRLQHFENTELLQDLLRRFEFSEEEITTFGNGWADWLKPRI